MMRDGSPKTCSIEGCEITHYALTYCKKHYRRFKKYGNPLELKVGWHANSVVLPGGYPETINGLTKRQSYMKVYNQYYRESRADELMVNRKSYQESNAEELNSRKREQYWENPQKFRDRVNAAYQKNPEKIKSSVLDYRSRNPAKISELRQRHRARLHDAPIVDLTRQEWETIKRMFNYRCAYCGKKPKQLTKDHITALSQGGGHTLTNIVPACQSCNSKKRAGHPLCPVQPILIA